MLSSSSFITYHILGIQAKNKAKMHHIETFLRLFHHLRELRSTYSVLESTYRRIFFSETKKAQLRRPTHNLGRPKLVSFHVTSVRSTQPHFRSTYCVNFSIFGSVRSTRPTLIHSKHSIFSSPLILITFGTANPNSSYSKLFKIILLTQNHQQPCLQSQERERKLCLDHPHNR